jgi:hypothetical protein
MVLPVILLLGAGAALEISRRVGAGERAAPAGAPGAAALAAREARLAAALAALQAELAAERAAHAVDAERAAGVADKCGSLEAQLAAALHALQAELAAERAAHAADAERAAGVAGKCGSLEAQVGALHARTEELATSADALLAERGGLREQARARHAISLPGVRGLPARFAWHAELGTSAEALLTGCKWCLCALLQWQAPTIVATTRYLWRRALRLRAAVQQHVTVLCLQTH